MAIDQLRYPDARGRRRPLAELTSHDLAGLLRHHQQETDFIAGVAQALEDHDADRVADLPPAIVADLGDLRREVV